MSKSQREKIEKGAMPVDYLQATVSNHKREHPECPANGFEECGEPGNRWNLTDIFPESPMDYWYPRPTTEEESERLQGRGRERKEGGKKRKEGTGDEGGGSEKSQTYGGSEVRGEANFQDARQRGRRP